MMGWMVAAVLACMVLVGGSVSWLLGRSLRRMREEDSILSERIDLHRRHMVFAALVCFGAVFFPFIALGQGVVSVGSAILMLLTCIPALAIRSRPWFGAIGAMALFTALSQLLFSADRSWWSEMAWMTLLLTCPFAGWTVLYTLPGIYRSPRSKVLKDGSSVNVAFALLGVSIPFLLIQWPSLASGETLLMIYAMAANAKGAFLPFFGAGAALLYGRRWSLRIGGICLIGVGTSHLALSSDYFLRKVVEDPLIAETSEFPATEAEFSVIHETWIEGDQWGLVVSPGGVWVGTRTAAEYDEDGYGETYRITNFSGEDFRLQALGIDFIDDRQFLAVVAAQNVGGGGELNAEVQSRRMAEPDSVQWRLRLPDIDLANGADIQVEGDRWKVVAGRGGERTLRFNGWLGRDEIERLVWSRRQSVPHLRYVGTGTRFLEVAWGGGAQKGDPGSWERIAGVFQCYYQPTILQFLDRSDSFSWATSGLRVDCQEGGPDEARLICAAGGPRSSWFWEVDLDAAVVAPIAEFGAHHGYSWSGSDLVVLMTDHLVAVDLKTMHRTRVPFPREASWGAGIDVGHGVMALSWPEDSETGKPGTYVVTLTLP